MLYILTVIIVTLSIFIETGCWLLVAGRWKLIEAGCWLLVAGRWKLIEAGCCLLVAGRWLLEAY